MARSANYQVFFIDHITGETLHVTPAGETYSLKLSNVVNGVGSFAMTLSGAVDWETLLPLDTLIEVRRYLESESTVEGLYFLRSFERFASEGEERFVVGGVHANHLLSRRVIDPRDDPLQSGGYSTKGGDAGDVIFDYITEQCETPLNASRAFPNFTVLPPATAGSTLGATFRYENLLEEMQRLARQGGVDFEIRRGAGQALECYIGTLGEDRRALQGQLPPYLVFDPQRGNALNPKLVENRRNEQTVAYALGDGATTDRTTFVVVNPRSNDSLYNRIEFAHDGRSVDKNAGVAALVTDAQAELIERRPRREFEFEIASDTGGAVYRTDWSLGDRVTVRWKSNVFQLRITEIEIEVSGSSERLRPKVEFL